MAELLEIFRCFPHWHPQRSHPTVNGEKHVARNADWMEVPAFLSTEHAACLDVPEAPTPIISLHLFWQLHPFTPAVLYLQCK